MHVTDLETPVLVVDLDILDANIAEMATYSAAHGLKLRPHIKTHKIPEIARMQIRSGASGITVAKLGEAEVMARAGIDDILIAYPVVGEAKLARLTKLAGSMRVAVSTDSLEVAEGISRAAKTAGVRVRILAEFDAGFRRCGVQTVDELVSLAQGMTRLPNLEFAGLMFYPGHVRTGAQEQIPVLKGIDSQLFEAQEKLYRSGIQVATVSGGSTPTAFQSHLMKTLTEIRPGTYVYNDMNTVRLGTTALLHCALAIHVTVVSTAVKGRAVIDGGSKTFSSDPCRSVDGAGYGYCIEHPEVVMEGLTEEHGHLKLADPAPRIKIGDRLRIVPNHVCVAVNLHNEVCCARGGEVVGSWPIEARGLVR
jgi:D-serine deaminase-like pyridoxal phosphate-dependent protein